jgi:NAD(P)-dependent dehydrogenase (short-subunit alcohol dehydrogenase family)
MTAQSTAPVRRDLHNATIDLDTANRRIAVVGRSDHPDDLSTPSRSARARRMLVARPGPVGWALADLAAARGWEVTVAAQTGARTPAPARNGATVVDVNGADDIARIAGDLSGFGGVHVVVVCVSHRLIRPELAAHSDGDWLSSYRRVVVDTVRTVTSAVDALRVSTDAVVIVVLETREAVAYPQVAAAAAAEAALPVVVQALGTELAADGIRVIGVTPTRPVTYRRDQSNAAQVQPQRGSRRPPAIYFARPSETARQLLRLAQQPPPSGDVVPLPSEMLPLELPARPIAPARTRGLVPVRKTGPAPGPRKRHRVIAAQAAAAHRTSRIPTR